MSTIYNTSMNSGGAEQKKLDRVAIDIPPMDDNPADADVNYLETQIYEYNVRTTGITDGRIVSFLIRDDRAEIIAGVYGWTWGGTCEIRYLWVREEFRRRGYGTALMDAAEREATARGCDQIVLDTHSFQGPGFYQQRGFEIIGSHCDYPRGHQNHYLRKKMR